MLRKIGLLFAALCVAPAHASYGYGQWAEELGIDMEASYSAVRVMETSEGTVRFVERRAPQKTYMEFEQEGMKGAAIIREDLDKAYMLLFPMNMYRETSISEAMAQAGGDTSVTDVERIGREAVNGMDATKFKATYKDKEGSGDGFIWVSDDGIPLRMDMTYQTGSRGDRINMTLQDLKVGAQDPKVFEVPAGMQPMNLGGLLGGFGGGNRQPTEQDAKQMEQGADDLRKAMEELRKRMGQ